MILSCSWGFERERRGPTTPLGRKGSKSRRRVEIGRNLLHQSRSTRRVGNHTPIVCLIWSKNECRSDF